MAAHLAANGQLFRYLTLLLLPLAVAGGAASGLVGEQCGGACLTEETSLLQLPLQKVSAVQQPAEPPDNATPVAAPPPQRSLTVAESGVSFLGRYKLVISYSAAVVGVTAIVVALFWNRGLCVIVQVLTYIGALSTIRLTVKLVEDSYGFKFPIFLTATHLVSSAIAAMIALPIVQTTARRPSPREFLAMFVPIGVSFAVSVAVSNMALIYSTAAFVEIVGATTPCVTVPMLLLMGQPFESILLLPVLIIVMGCAISSTGDLSFSAIGLILAFGGNVARALKSALQQVLLRQGPDSEPYTPLEVMTWVSIPSALLMMAWSLGAEGLAPMKNLASPGLLSALLLSCVNATVLNLAVLFVVRELGAVGSQLVGQAKSILTVLGSMALFGEKVSPLEILGFVLVMAGVYWYNRLDARAKEARGPPALGK